MGEIGQLAASVVDGDLHRRLLDPANYSDELYDRALEPLVRFHSANPNMVDRGGVAHFVLDPAASPHLHSSHKLKASAYMERFNNPKEYDDGWLEQIAAGKTYVTPEFEHDEYGDFLSGHPAHRRRQSEEDQRPSRSRCWRCGHCMHCGGHPPKYPRG